MRCGDRACEDKVKEELSATSRCMPFEQEELSDVCVCCGKKAKKMVVWGKAYQFNNNSKDSPTSIGGEMNCYWKINGSGGRREIGIPY